MSIMRLRKVTLLGHIDDKRRVLDELQTLGCLHLIPLGGEGAARAGHGPSQEAAEALRFLLECPQKRRQARDTSTFDALEVEHEVLELKRRLQDLQDERDFLVKRIKDLEPWGNFRFPPVEGLDYLRLWFYLVPNYRLREVEETGLCWEVVHRDTRYCYVVVISPEEPEGMPVKRTHTGAKPLRELEGRLDEVELAIEDAEASRTSLTRWCVAYASSLDQLEDLAALEHASTQTQDADPVFALSAWAPKERIDELYGYADHHGMVIDVRKPTRDETPPTLLRNEAALAGGQDLVTFYMTPGYWTWDPSIAVFISFSIFFGMILADVGYGAVLGLIAVAYWKKMGGGPTGRRLRILLVCLVAATVLYGALVGSYFGVSPAPGSPLDHFHVFDLYDAPTMMLFSIGVGAIHVALANLAEAWRLRRSSAALAPLGWVFIVLGGLVLYLAQEAGQEGIADMSIAFMLVGLAMAVLFTGAGQPLLSRTLRGLLSITKLTNAFGDVMSYLRLFALGLATASLATAFNGMAAEARAQETGLGVLTAGLVLIIGHTLNFVLGLMSAVVHGLRLNVIEFFNWGVTEEGYLYQPFNRKEERPWTQSS
ncbi:MAG: V-type ATP synthase subunit I [Chromatiales bacterium]|nr:MAG: V-type ATP synthase subunit I [Chromatiales bacterium]